jgi:ABC-type multidrug transport system ATPase subunit
MVRDRQIIVLDEPFNHIDTEGKEAVRKFIIECEKRNKTIILITHHMIDLNNEWRILEFK